MCGVDGGKDLFERLKFGYGGSGKEGNIMPLLDAVVQVCADVHTTTDPANEK